MLCDYKNVCFWLIVVGLCFVAIPFHIVDLTDDDTPAGNKSSTNSSHGYKNISDPIVEAFTSFLSEFNKTYKDDPLEFTSRYQIFKSNLEKAAELNHLREDSKEAIYGVTKFSDMTQEEFVKNHLLNRNKTKYAAKTPNRLLKAGIVGSEIPASLPRKMDWRKKHVIGPIQNQESCGGCWAFSTVGTVESMNAIRNKKFYELSVQQMLDCSGNGNMGCGGGDPCSAIEWMIQRDIRLSPAKDYPLVLRDQQCKKTKPKKTVRISSNYTCLNLESMESVILHMLAYHGPVIVAVDSTSWQHYLGGIIRFHCGTDQNHAVQIVGYDLTGSVPYYIIRNSWGEEFGIDGYIHVAFGKNLCGIANEVATLDVLRSRR